MKLYYWKRYRTFVVLMVVELLFVLNSIPTHGQSTTAPLVSAPADAVHTQHFLAKIANAPTLSSPWMLTVDSSGTIYVSDFGFDVVKAFSAAGALLHTYGTGTGTGNGQFKSPAGVAVVGNDVFIVDNDNNRIQHFNKTTGAFISQFGTTGSALGQLAAPVQMAYNPLNGLLYVAENGNARVQRFTTAGVSQGIFGSTGTGSGQFTRPFGLAIDPLGYVYVSDFVANRIQKFSTTGTFIRTIGGPGTGDGQFSQPQGLAFDRAGFLYAADTGNNRVQKFDWQGGFAGQYRTGEANCNVINAAICNGFFANVIGVAVSNIANAQPILYTADTGNSTVQAFETALQPVSHPFEAKWGSFGTGPGQFNTPSGVTTDSVGNVYVSDSRNNRIQKFDKFGVFIRQWGSHGNGIGQFVGPVGIAINAANNVFVVDNVNNRIQVFDTDGGFLRQWGSSGTGNSQFNSPEGIAVDSNFVYIVDGNNNRIQKFDFSGTYVSQWGSFGTGQGQFISPVGVAVDLNRQFVYVVEFTGQRVQIFTTTGNFVSLVTDSMTGPGKLSGSSDIETDQHGNFYVTDSNRVVQFNDNGQYMAAFGGTGSGDGQFGVPFGIAIDHNSGQIFVTDVNRNRIQRFGSTNPKNDTVGVWRPSTRTFFLRNANTTGVADISVDTSNFTLSTDQPIVGDWNGDGVSTVGVYRNGLFLLRDSNVAGSPDYTFALGVAGDVPIVGDWNADGKDSVGVFRPSNGLIFLKNDLTTGFADYQMVLGAPGDIGVAGDWNGDGQDSAGVRRPNTIQFFLADKVVNGSTFAEHSLQLGASTDLPFTGDWVHQGTSGVGIFRPSNGLIFLKNNLTPGFADTQITLGIAGDVPVAGYWGRVPAEVIPAIAPAVGVPTIQPTPRLAPTFVPSGK